MFSYRSVIFLAVVSSIHAYYDDYDGFSYNRYVSPKADHCQQQGTQCSEDCTAVLYCSAEGVAPIVISNCTSNGLSCSSNYTVTAACSSVSDCAAAGEQLAIQCNEAGNFPDPYNCRKSYTCESNNPDPTEQCTCPPASFWADPSADCNTDSSGFQGCCEDFEVDCNATRVGGNFGACLLTTSGYYYICERGSGTISISLHKCSTAEQIWNETSYRCETVSGDLLDFYNEEEINLNQKSVKVLPICDSLTTLPTTTTTEQSSDTTTTTEQSSDTTTTTELSTDTPTTETTTTTETLPTPPTDCTFVGEIIAIPGECRLYFVCDENLQPELRECEEGSHLDCSLNGCYCVFGPCPP